MSLFLAHSVVGYDAAVWPELRADRKWPDHRQDSANDPNDLRSLGPRRFYQLLDDVKLDLCDPTSNHPQRIGRGM
jgi:hypothetical protein